MAKIDNLVNRYLKEEGVDNVEFMLSELAKGWDEESVKKFAKSLGFDSAKEKGFFDACVKRMKKNDMNDPEGFCAEVKDKAWGTTMWRGKGKSKEDVKKAKKKED